MIEFSEFEKKAGVRFKNENLLKQAFVHRSYLNENKDFSLGHNERLEFLGDAVLELAVTDFLYNKYPKKNEGELTSLRSALVNTNNLSSVGGELSLDKYLMLSKGEARDKGRARQYILANTMEAVIGAIYLDQGYDEANKFIRNHICSITEKIVKEGSWIDSKSLFQEKSQDVHGITPSYRIIKEVGPDHNKNFTVGVYLNKELIASGRGTSKQEAEQEAARKALKEKGWD